MPFLIALALAFVLTPVAAWVGRATALVNRPDGDPLKIHGQAVPVLGGAAVIVSALAALAAVHGAPPAGVGVAVAIAFGVGLVDDARGLAPRVQTISLLAAGVALALWAAQLAPLGYVGPAAIVFLVFACTNATNFLDGQDGLAGGLAAIAALGLVALIGADGDGMSDLGLALAGSLAGFLVWNRSPVPVFLGNGGAYAIGALLAALATAAIDDLGTEGLLAVGLCLGVFAFELAFTVFRRIASGQALAAGDRLHSYDLLAVEVGSRAKVTAIFCAIGALAAALGLIANAIPVVPAAAVAIGACCAAALGAIRLWSPSSERGAPPARQLSDLEQHDHVHDPEDREHDRPAVQVSLHERTAAERPGAGADAERARQPGVLPRVQEHEQGHDDREDDLETEEDALHGKAG
jgi:UDP-GlcNAc:undecaprenyl-phosphate GlcNAc-1-phosphate transferase